MVMKTERESPLSILLIPVVSLFLTGCAEYGVRSDPVEIGAATGAIAGAVVGYNTKGHHKGSRAAVGALAGAALGGAAGYAVESSQERVVDNGGWHH
jgi:outer membrane lipoprotein SlyB